MLRFFTPKQSEFSMPRLLLCDEHWSKLRQILLQINIYDKHNLRMAVEAMLYRMRTGCPWRDLPESFGCWNTIYKRFNAWSASGKWLQIFKALMIEPDLEWAFIDGSYIKAHQHSAGAASDEDNGIGKSRAGNTSKIHLVVDAHGLPIDYQITGGQVHDSSVAPELILSMPEVEVFIADKGYDSDAVRNIIEAQEAESVIPRRRNSVKGNDGLDRGLYRYRHLVENAFARLKHYRAVASRYEKLKRNYEAVVAMACSLIWLPM